MKRLVYFTCLALGALIMLSGCQKETPSNLPEFTVSFNTDGGSEIKDVKVRENEKITKPSDPTKGEFIFVGWFKEATWVNAWDFSKDVVTKDMTLYAKWTTVTYTITFETNGGSAIAPITVAKGSTAQKPIAPTKSGVAFDNWYKEAALTTVYDFNTAVNADMTLYAKWISVTRETLEALVNEAMQISYENYTKESYDAMNAKKEAAYQLLRQENPTTEQITTAYSELAAAMNALVSLPKRAVVAIDVERVIDGILYVNPGQSFNVYASAVDATGEYATDRRVTFTYDAAQLATWAEGPIQVDDRSLRFGAKSALTAGQTISLTVASAENPAITTTVTLKVPAQGEQKTAFINAVNALPSPDQIKYEHVEAIDKAFDMYFALPNIDHEDAAVKAAYEKLEKCDDAYAKLPLRVKYVFKGNICTFTGLEGATGVEELGEYTYAANGAFPAGTYTQNGWDEDGKDGFYQSRLTFATDGTGFLEDREANDANGTGATPWDKGSDFTYTNQGTQAAGGMFLITMDWDEEEPNVSQQLVRSLGRSK